MTHLTAADILDIATFVAERPGLESKVIADKAPRRVGVGPNLTFLFENRLSCWWQIQEMCRVENLITPAAVQHELDTYNALLPGPSELSAVLLVEVDDPDARKALLRMLIGLEACVSLEIEGASPQRAVFDEAQFDRERISAVQFVRVPLDATARAGLADLGRQVGLVVDHPAYRHRSALGGATRAALVDDLREMS